MSRFGRQYLEVSKFIEQIFPCLGVRFISVTDRYDSGCHKGTTAELDIPVKNMINAMYSKDISRKVKSAVQTKKRQGEVMNGIAVFGYKVEGTEKRRTVIDEPAAEIVRHIFSLALNGLSSFKIAEKLNAADVITPASYKTQNGCNLVFKTADRNLWTVEMVSRILRDERYTGTFISCMRESAKIGTDKKKRLPKEAWIRKPDAHPAVISSDLFNKVTEKRKKAVVTHTKPNTDRVLYKKVMCGHCGHIMRYETGAKYPRYACETARYSEKYGCSRDKITEQDIINAVKTAVSAQIKILVEIEYRKKSADKESSAVKLDGDIKKLRNAKRLLYERYKEGGIDKPAYISGLKAADADITAKTAERNAISSADELQTHQELHELSMEITDKLIESVYVYGKEIIELKFSFKDEFKNNAEIAKV